MSALGPDDRFALVFAVAITSLVALVWRRQRGALYIALAAVLPAPIVALFSKQFDLAGWHGFMHAAPIYQVMERGGLHPEEPLFAGGELRYPWVEHWLTAKVAAVTGLNTHVLALCAETAALILFVAAVAVLSSTMTSDRVTIALASLLSLFGVSVFHMSLFLGPLSRIAPSLWLETRVVAVDKFLNVTAMPIGFAAMALAAAAAVHMTSNTSRPRRLAVLIGACTIVAAIVHPLSWLGILVWQGVTAIVLLAGTRDERDRAVLIAFAVGVSSLICFPYLRSVGASESSDGWSGLTRPWSLLGAKAADLAMYLATVAVFAYLNRAELRRLIRERHRPTLILLGTIAAMSLAYLVVRLPGRNEYKFLLHLAPAAAVLIALSLRRLLDRSVPIAAGLLFLLLIPAGRVLGSRPWFQVTDPVRTDGPYLRALDPQVDSLYQWVVHNTRTDAVFIAPDLRIPPLGRRSLYIAADAPWVGRDGWGLPRNSLLQWHVRRPDSVMYRRQRYASIILASSWEIPASAVMAFVETDVPGRPLYVHAQSTSTIAKLDASPDFLRWFANAAGAVYEYLPPHDTRGQSR